jgi:CHASE2 domain-containing sensor protein
MLSREDNQRLAELERQLRREDPEFCARMTDGIAHPLSRRGPRRGPVLSLLLIVVVLWAAAITLAVLGWWIAAVITAVLATTATSVLTFHLIRRRHTDSA